MQTIMPPINTEDGLFHEGNPSQGTQGTIVTALHLNNQQAATRDIQKELTAILTEAGMLPDGTKPNQVLLAIKKLFTGTVSDKYLPLTGGELTGQLSINHADFINKNGYTTYNDGDGSLHRQAGGLRLAIADTILTEFYYNETAGISAEVLMHNKYGSTDSYYSLRNDGQFSVIGVSPQVILSNGTVFATDGNVKGRVWDNGYLSTWLNNQLSARDTNIENRVDWVTFNKEVGARATIDWVNANFVNRMQRGAQGSMTMDGGLVEAPAGCVLTGGNGNEGNQVGMALYRPLQILRGGSWVTIEG